MTFRVVHFVSANFGIGFSGHTHYLFSLLSGWNEKGITMDFVWFSNQTFKPK
jgi:hypothetical protein